MKQNNQSKTLVIFILILISLSCFTSADPYRDYINKPSSPASLPSSGLLSANINTGAAVYSYPIQVMPGTNGLQPGLSLSYSSLNSKSYPELVGSGWALTQSYIQRDTNDFPGDTSKHKFNLILSGASHELVYDSTDGRYHTKIESYLSIKKLSGGDNTKNEYWEVKTKDGTTYRFGYDSDSELMSNQHNYVWRWYLDQVTDTHDNNIYYSYLEDPSSGETGVTYIHKIEYNNDKKRRIEFGYVALPRSWTIFQGGQKITRKSRLTEIRIYYDNTMIRKYGIGYTNNNIATRTYISSITEYGKDGGSLPSTTFSYTNLEKGWERDRDIENKLPPAYFSYNNLDGGSRLIDINRDGMVDIVANFHHVWAGKYAFLNLFNGDFNRDDTFAPPAKFIDRYDTNIFFDMGVRLGDYNGDGYPDLIQGVYDEDADDEDYDIWTNTGNGWSLSSHDFVTKFVTIEDNSNNYKYVDEGVRLVDLNGDGYVDVLKAKQGQSKQAWINNQNGGWSSASNWNLPSNIYFIESDGDDEGVRLIDMNGDGLTDVYRSDDDYSKELWLNTGNGWEQTSSWPISNLPDNVDAGNDDEGIRFSDINGDGLADVLQGRETTRAAFINHGNNLVSDSSWDIPEFAEFVMNDGSNEGTRMVDINGDGSADIVRMKSNSGSITKLVWLNKANKQFLLDEVKNSAGAKHKIEYFNSGETENNKIGFNQWIVKSISLVDMLDHHDVNSNIDCVPASCPNGYDDKGIDCSGDDACVRICEIRSCGDWTKVMESTNPWSNYDLPQDAIGMPLFSTGFEDGKCYKVETSSDDNIVDESRIYDEDTSETDAVIVLYWEMSGLSEQPWGGDCGSDAHGLLRKNNHYLIDDKDSGNDYESADNIGGTWIGYCMPPEKGCSGYSTCTTECYGNTWRYSFYAIPDVEDGYEPGNPDDENGACKAQTTGPALNDYVDFKSGTSASMHVWKADMVVSGSSNQVCSKTPSIKTFYTYTGGYYDFGDKEFRGFGYVEELRPDNSKVKHYYHQDDSKKGMEYKTEMFDDKNRPYFKNENEASSTTTNGYHVVTLDSTKNYNYDGVAENPVITQTDYEYDDYGNVEKTSMLGEISVDDDERYSYTEYTYDTDKWILNIPTKTYLRSSDDSTKVSESYFEYNELGDLIRSESWLDTGENPVMTYGYDAYGNRVSETNARRKTTEYEYDSTHTFPIKTTNAKDQEMVFEYNLATGNVLSATDPNGYKTEYKYDQFGRKIKDILPYDTESKPTSEIVYNLDGNVPESVIVKQKQNDDMVSEQHYYYDGSGNVVQIKSDSSGSDHITKDFYYNLVGGLKWESNPYLMSSNSYSSPNSQVKKTNYEYDALGKVKKIINPDNTNVEIDRFRQLTSFFDENDHRIDYIEDLFGNVVNVREYNKGNIFDTYYTYDVVGNLIKINDSQGNEFDYNYDTLGRKTMMDDPDLGIWTYEYDASGNLVKQADNKGNQIELSYDELDRLKTKTVGSISESYRYDAGVVGTLSKIETNDIVKEFTYDQRLRIVEDKKTINGIDFVTTYTYDSADAVLSKTLPNGEIIDYTYDNVGNIKTVSDVVSDQQYNEDNQLVSRVYENALTSNYEYNPDNYKINRISTSDLQDLNYDLDAKNNIVIINDEIHDEQIDYEYDDLDRLTSATKTSQSDDEIIYDLGYYYDSIGNMLYFTSSEEEDDIDFIYEGSLAHAPSSVIFNSITTNRAPIVGIVEDITVDETDVVLLKFNVLDVPPAEGGGSIGGGPGGLSIESEHIIEVHDPDNDTLTYSVDNENFVQDQVDESLFRWETGYEDSDEYIIIVSASDGNFSDGRSFILTINNINREPRMDDVEDFWWEENQPIWMPFFAFDDDIEQDLEMTMVNGPEDAVFGNCEYSINESKETDKTQASCIFEWTPDYDSAGNHTIEFMLSDNDSQVTESFVIEVRDVNREPIINTKFRLSENFDNDLDTDFWDETTDHENWPFVDEHYVDLNKDVYHTAQLSPSNKVILLSMDHDFESGDIIEYEVNYLEGDGNILSRLTINNNPLDLMLGNVCNGHATCGNVGFWNGESAVGNIYGTYQVKLIFQNDSVNVNFINPNNEKFSYTSNEISPPFKFGVSTRTGHNGVGHIDYDNFKINSLSVDENELFLYKVDAEDPDDDTLTYALESDPIGMDIDSDGEITWQTDYENAGIYNLTVTVSDPYVSVIEEFALTINNINREPRMDDVEDFWWEENQPIWMPFFAFDDDDETDFEMSLVNGPQGAILHDCEYSINETKETGKTQAMCIFEWTPGYDDAGNYTIEFMLDDGDSQVTESFVIEVRDVNQDPIFDPIEDKSVEVGEELTVIISAKDYDKDSMDIASDFDKLIPFVSGTGSGSPADYSTISQTYKWSPNNQDYGIHNATFTVTDSKGGEDTESMLITVEGCIEDWLCGDWTECENSSQTRACFDFNKCGTIENKPEEEQECCVEDWECGSWNDCIDGLQTRTCTDDNQCGTIEHKPVAEQTCCAEDWECGDWSVCVDSLQTRTCTDNNLCGTIDDKPIEEQSCCAEYWNCTAWSDCVDSLQTRICTDDNLCGTIEDKPEQEQECCAEDWTCGSWGECIDSLQSRTCTDNNQCGTIVDKPDTSQECCVEDWDCSVWSDCENSSQMRVCVDFSNCGTIEDKPITEQECEMPCIEDWSCGDWSECDDSLQSRICTDDNQCGTIEQKPEEEQECEMPCIEEWQCGNWTICDNEEQNRTCLDINDCGTIDDKPEEQQACEMPCIEDWTCGNWSECNNSLQSRTCTDDNQCGTIEDKPEEQQECEMPCVEDWECSVWSDCIDSLQTRVCVDFSYCDTIEDKPITEQACEMPCVEDWTCSDWTECDDSLQSRICIDDNQCSTIDDKPDEEQECEMPCIENWTCSKWSQCVDEIQTRTCADFNNCRTVDDKPEEEQECEIPNNSPVLEHINDTEIDENKVLDIWVEASDEDEDDDLTLTHNFTEYFQVAENYDYDTSIRRKYRWRPGSEDSGIYNVLFTVTDLRGAKDYEEIIITVNDIIENAAPEILPEIPDQEVEMNSDPWSIDLTDYETDDQDSGRDLRWKIIGGNKNLVQTSLNTNTDELKFYPIEDEFGETTIRLTLKDSDGKTDTQNVKVIINKIDNDHDYKINIGAKDINNDHINSRIELDGKQKYANPFAYFKMQFNQIIPFKVQSKDYTTKEGDYYFDEQVTSCTDSCSFTTNGYTTQCDKDNFQFRCECSVGGNNFDYVYVPPTEEFLLSEKLRKCSVACITDANCNDNKPDTKDFCIYPGKCNARCENEPCNVECKSNSGCDDNNASTKDICFLPKTCNSYCKHKPTSCNMECMSNDDCDDGRDDTYNLCRRARTCQAVCEFISIPNLKPDLVIEDFNVQTYFNKIVVVKFKIKNSGDTIAENVKWQLDTGGGLSNPQSSEDLTLRVDESAVVYSMGNYENSGSYTMVLTIDPDNLVKEKDESDNVDELGVSVS